MLYIYFYYDFPAACLQEIRANIYSYNIKLYRACANASPYDMNDAMIGISKEVSVYVQSSMSK